METREEIATRIHTVYIPNDTNCSFTDKDWYVAKEIAELQAEYFTGLSTLVINSLTQDPEHYIKSCLNDPVFLRFFHGLREKHKLSEYYLADSNGSFLFADVKGKLSLLVIKDDLAMAGSAFDAEMADIKPSPKVQDQLNQRKKILYLHHNDDWTVSPSEWDQRDFLHKANTVEGGRQTYFYAYIDDLKPYGVDEQKVHAFGV